MILKLYSIYDSKVESFTNPMCFKTRGEAIRSIVDLLAEGKTQFATHPEDFTLFELGSWDSSKSEFDIYPATVSVGKLLEFMPQTS